MKKSKYIILLLGLLLCFNVSAEGKCEVGQKTINTDFGEIIKVNSFRETTKENDNYDTIERNSTIIGKTKFTDGVIVTALKAAKAGANDLLLYTNSLGEYLSDYKYPEIYTYYGEIGGWYKLDENNTPTYIDNEDLIQDLSNQNIYFVNNKFKGIYIGNYDFNNTDCVNSNLYFDKKSDLTDNKVNGDIYISSYMQNLKFTNLGDRTNDIELNFNEKEGKYEVLNYDVEVVDIKDSITNQKYLYIKCSTGNYVDGKIKIIYVNGKEEDINVKSSGYLVPNMNAIKEMIII